MQLVFTTVSTAADARRLSDSLVAARLAACVSHHPIRSVYLWKGKTKRSSEYLLEAKTARPAAAMAWLKKHHPYELPVIYALKPSAIDKAAAAWVKKVSK